MTESFHDLKLLFPLKTACKILHDRADAALLKVGDCTLRELWVLLCVYEIRMNQRQVGSILKLHQNAIVKLIDGMESKGLARRERVLDDRRTQMVEITEKGRAILLKYQVERSRMSADIFRPLDERQIEAFMQLSMKVVESD